MPPRASADIDQATQAELAALRSQVRETEEKLAAAHASAEELAKARAAAEELARQASADSAVWEQTAVETEANQAALARKLEELQKAAEAQPEQLQIEFKQAGLQAASRLELDERQTRRLIDVQLVDAGWQADSDRLTYQKGVRPEEGRNLAIAEWPCEGGRADFALFVGLTCVGIVEAKRESAKRAAELQSSESLGGRAREAMGRLVAAPAHSMEDVRDLPRQDLLCREPPQEIVGGLARGGIIDAGEGRNLLDHVLAELTALNQRGVCIFGEKALGQRSEAMQLLADLL